MAMPTPTMRTYTIDEIRRRLGGLGWALRGMCAGGVVPK